MILSELFSSSQKITVSAKMDDVYKTHCNIGKEQYFFEADYLKRSRGEYWGIAFGTYGHRGPFNLTKAGNPAQVLAFAKTSLEMFIKEYDPKLIIFTGDDGRDQTYEKMLDRYLGREYTLTKRKTSVGTEFTLTKKS